MKRLFLPAVLVLSAIATPAFADQNVMIEGLPDYNWYAGCFGTATGNLMGYWDRTGFPDFYTGPTGNGVAPLNSFGLNRGIRSMWASKAGFDGRSPNQPGHADDYWTYLISDQSYSYESTDTDPFVIAGRPEHTADCLCDFMGASQKKWSDLNGECAGNIDAFAFNYWDKQGALRVNFTPPSTNGQAIREVQSGIRQWTRYRGYDANVASQLADFNPLVPAGGGFHFEDLKAEILRGYPLILMLQKPAELSRNLPGMARANPEIHAIIAFHFLETDAGDQLVQYRTSWASGEAAESWAAWGPQDWAGLPGMTLRGAILFHPLPKITTIERANNKVTVRWDGPTSTLWDDINQVETPAHSYTVERAGSLGGEFVQVGDPTTDRQLTIDDPGTADLFLRVKLTTPAYTGAAGFSQ
jgi:hypothetical protein